MKANMGHKDLPQNAVPGPNAADDKSSFSLISNQKLLEIYAAILRMSILAERSISDAGSNAGMSGLPAGREAIVAGVTIDLLPEDTVLSSPQNLLPGFLREVSLQVILAGKDARLPGFLAPASGPEARFNLAIGAALAGKIQGGDSIAVLFADERETASADARAALAFAGAQELPVIFVCDSMNENGRSRAESAADRAKACSVPGIAVDGNDAVAVYRVASESISRARLGRGPTLIDCHSFRIHPEPRSRGAKSKDSGETAPHDGPVPQMEQYLINKGIFRAGEKAAVCSGFIDQLSQQGWVVSPDFAISR